MDVQFADMVEPVDPVQRPDRRDRPKGVIIPDDLFSKDARLPATRCLPMDWRHGGDSRCFLNRALVDVAAGNDIGWEPSGRPELQHLAVLLPDVGNFTVEPSAQSRVGGAKPEGKALPDERLDQHMQYSLNTTAHREELVVSGARHKR